MSFANYSCVLVIVFVGLSRGLTSAVAMGIAIQTVLMVQQASTVDPVYRAGSSDGGFISTRIRNMDDASRLRWGRHTVGKLEVVRLQGPIFFGVAPTLEDEMQELFNCLPNTPSHFILDLSRVTQVDDTGAHALAEVLKHAKKKKSDMRIAVTGASLDVETKLKIEGVAEDPREAWLKTGVSRQSSHGMMAELRHTLEEALDEFEDELLSETRSTEFLDEERQYLAKSFMAVWDARICAGASCEYPAKIQDKTWELVKAASSATRLLNDKTPLCDFGDLVDGIWVLVSGKVVVETRVAASSTKIMQREENRPVKIVAKYEAPFAIGSSAFFLQAKRHGFRMRGYGEGGATVLVFTERDLKQLQQNQPAAYSEFITNYVGFSLATESIHTRWRSAQND